jgi:hypothetical protein
LFAFFRASCSEVRERGFSEETDFEGLEGTGFEDLGGIGFEDLGRTGFESLGETDFEGLGGTDFESLRGTDFEDLTGEPTTFEELFLTDFGKSLLGDEDRFRCRL